MDKSKRLRLIGKDVGVWMITLFLFRAFARAGYNKLQEQSGWTAAFAAWGYSVWFRKLVGVAELAGSILILIPRIAAFGAMILFLVMMGAIGTHLRFGEYLDIYNSDLAVFCFAFAVLLCRWPCRTDSSA